MSSGCWANTIRPTIWRNPDVANRHTDHPLSFVENIMTRPAHNPSRVSPRRSLAVELPLACALVLLILLSRIFLDVPNFKPVMAIAMLSGFLFSRRWLGVTTVLSGMLLSDVLIGFYDWRVAMVVYVAIACPVVAGLFLKRWRGSFLRMSAGVIGFAGLSAVNFYLLTTLAVWGCFEWYSADLAGLATALLMGLPFLKWSLGGNILFSGLLFGAWSLIQSISPARVDVVLAREQAIPVPVKK